MSYRVALGQILVEGGRPVARPRSRRCWRCCRRREGCRVVVLPECLDLGWAHPSALDAAQPVPGPHSDRLAQAAREHGIYVAAGFG